MRTALVAAIGAVLIGVRPLSAQSTAPPPQAQAVEQVRGDLERLRKEFEALRLQYDQRLLALEQRLAQLTGGPAVTGTTGTPGTTEQGSPQPPPQAYASSKVFNPDMSVIGNFVGVAGKNEFSGQPSLQLSEVEAAFQAVVDPYARADFFIAGGPEGFEVEEGYITFTALPANLLLKVGKMRAQFGKVNTLHTHIMPTVDRPLVTENLVGGEEGLSDAGLSIAHLVNNPHLFLELTGEVYAGRSEVFQSSQRSKLAYVGRVRAYRDLTEATNLDIGASFASGPTDAGVALDKHLFAVDATFRYRPLRRAIYRRLNLRTELIWSRQQIAAAERQSAFGFYGLGEYQFARRWYAGARLDRSGRTYEADAVDTGGSVFVTFWPTEFSQVRGQFRRVNFAEGIKANEFLFQVNFSIGAHGAHVF